MGAIKVFVLAGEDQRQLEIETNLPVGTRNSMVVAVDPMNWAEVGSLAWGGCIYRCRWHCGGHTHDLFFVLPDILNARTEVPISIRKWKSASLSSDSLYPWWINAVDAGADLICQIHPMGSSSIHFHEPEEGMAVAETYWPILNDGHTLLQVDGGKAESLASRHDILPKQRHQLIRKVPGFSIQLLVMNSRRYRFPDKGGHCLV